MAHINEEVRQRLISLREQKGLQKQEISDALNITRHQYYYMENTGHIPTHRIPALCEFLGVTPEFLIDGKEGRAPTRIISDEEMKIIHRVDELSDESKKLLNDNLDKNESFFNDTDIKLLNDIYALDEHNKEFLIEFLNKLKKATD